MIKTGLVFLSYLSLPHGEPYRQSFRVDWQGEWGLRYLRQKKLLGGRGRGEGWGMRWERKEGPIRSHR